MKELDYYLKYEQPTKYIVSSDSYDETYRIPVLTAGQSFLLGYTSETENVFPADKLPVIIFDDFTTSTQFVNFPFKVKSSALKILHATENANIKYFYYLLKTIKTNTNIHKRYWISEVSKRLVKEISLEQQNKVVQKLDLINEAIINRKNMIKDLNNYLESKFNELFINTSSYVKEELKENVVEMFIGPFGSSLKNDCFVTKEEGFCVVYEQKHAINKHVGDFRYISHDKYMELERFNIIPNDIIVSCRGTIGKTYIIPENAPLGVMHPSIMKIRLNTEKYNPKFFELLLSKYLEFKKKQSNGSTIKMAIKAKELEKEKFIVPDIEAQNSFVDILNLIQDQIKECESDIQDLEKLLDNKSQEFFF